MSSFQFDFSNLSFSNLGFAYAQDPFLVDIQCREVSGEPLNSEIKTVFTHKLDYAYQISNGSAIQLQPELCIYVYDTKGFKHNPGIIFIEPAKLVNNKWVIVNAYTEKRYLQAYRSKIKDKELKEMVLGNNVQSQPQLEPEYPVLIRCHLVTTSELFETCCGLNQDITALICEYIGSSITKSSLEPVHLSYSRPVSIWTEVHGLKQEKCKPFYYELKLSSAINGETLNEYLCNYMKKYINDRFKFLKLDEITGECTEQCIESIQLLPSAQLLRFDSKNWWGDGQYLCCVSGFTIKGCNFLFRFDDLETLVYKKLNPYQYEYLPQPNLHEDSGLIIQPNIISVVTYQPIFDAYKPTYWTKDVNTITPTLVTSNSRFLEYRFILIDVSHPFLKLNVIAPW